MTAKKIDPDASAALKEYFLNASLLAMAKSVLPKTSFGELQVPQISSDNFKKFADEHCNQYKSGAVA